MRAQLGLSPLQELLFLPISQDIYTGRGSQTLAGDEKPKLCKENIPGIFSGSGSVGTSGSSNCSCKDIKDNVSHVSHTTTVGKHWAGSVPDFPPD